MPEAITFADGSSISYLYRADGEKLRTVFSSGGSSHSADYCQGVIYENGTQKERLGATRF